VLRREKLLETNEIDNDGNKLRKPHVSIWQNDCGLRQLATWPLYQKDWLQLSDPITSHPLQQTDICHL